MAGILAIFASATLWAKVVEGILTFLNNVTVQIGNKDQQNAGIAAATSAALQHSMDMVAKARAAEKAVDDAVKADPSKVREPDSDMEPD